MDGTKNEIKTINGGKEGEYGKNFIKIKFDTDNNLPLNKPLKLRMLTIIVRSVFEEDGKFSSLFRWVVVWVIRMQVKIRQMKIKNRPEYLFNGNMIVNIKDFDSSLLEINKLSFKGVFSLNISYIKYTPTKCLDHLNVDNNNNEDFFHLFLDDVDGHIGKKKWN